VKSSDSSHKVWESIERNVEKYKIILQKLANDFNTLEKDLDLITKMKELPILLGVLEGDINDVNNIDGRKKYTLDSVKNIYINDNATYLEIYRDLLTIPEGYPKFFYEVCYYYL